MIKFTINSNSRCRDAIYISEHFSTKCHQQLANINAYLTNQWHFKEKHFFSSPLLKATTGPIVGPSTPSSTVVAFDSDKSSGFLKFFESVEWSSTSSVPIVAKVPCVKCREISSSSSSLIDTSIVLVVTRESSINSSLEFVLSTLVLSSLSSNSTLEVTRNSLLSSLSSFTYKHHSISLNDVWKFN